MSTNMILKYEFNIIILKNFLNLPLKHQLAHHRACLILESFNYVSKILD